MKKIIQFLLLFLYISFISAQESLSITGVDTSKILINGAVDVYVSLNSDDSDALSELDGDDFSLEEYDSSQEKWSDASIRSFQYNGFSPEDISILLLVDNSGSMYDSIAGESESVREKQRISYLFSALRDLFDKTGGYKDSLALFTFNTYITEEHGFSSDRSSLFKSLNNINQPGRDESFTELYRGMNTAMEKLSRRKGRKVLILLTDGENYTYSENREEPHPVFGNNLIDQEKLVEQYRKSGITLYTIFYTREEDPELDLLSEKTGGQSYMASSRNELVNAYLEIHDRISKEFRLSYTPFISTNREKTIRVSLHNSVVSAGFAYLWEIFWGLPPELQWWFYLILTVISVGIIVVIHNTPFERLYPYSHLEVLSPADESSTILQLSENRTLIAVSSQKTEIIHEDNFNSRNDEETGVTIIKEADNTYTLQSEKEVMVNNQPVKIKKLNPGDVIRAEGTLIVFDEAED
ncbi:MAG: hypothetical protein B6241_02590 [Spirochaetaceae bacterium 4572_59]|nr:MAG: hypothetical protein B6241_02590 [Spirochaetaceae bacterium 4572_59]